MKSYKVHVFDEKTHETLKEFETNIITRTKYKDKYRYCLDFVNTDIKMSIENLVKIYTLKYENNDKDIIGFVCNEDMKADLIVQNQKLADYLDNITEGWTALTFTDGEYIDLDTVLTTTVEKPTEIYNVNIKVDLECKVTNAESEADAIIAVLERLNKGDLPAAIYESRYKVKYLLDVDAAELLYYWKEIESTTVATVIELDDLVRDINLQKYYYCTEVGKFYQIIKENGVVKKSEITYTVQDTFPTPTKELYKTYIKVSDKIYMEDKYNG